MKKLVLVFLLICSLLSLTACECKHEWKDATCSDPQTCMSCGAIGGSALGHNFMSATYEKPEICNRCGETRGEKLVSVSEWGFNYLNKMGNALVWIYEYDLSDAKNAYVIASGDMYKFDNGYMLSWDFTEDNGKIVFKTPSNPSVFKIVNNDNLTLDNGWSSMTIKDRKTSKNFDEFITFVIRKGGWRNDNWFVPYALIDWSRDVIVQKSPEYGTAYKLYLAL